MSMKALEDLRNTFCEELEDIARKPELSAGDLETVHKLTDTIKNIDKICMLEEGDKYSMDGEWEAGMRGRYSRDNSYDGNDGGSSYANRGRHYVRAHYSRDDGYSGRRGRGGYSRDEGKESMTQRLREMADEARSDREREAIEQAIRQLQNG